MTRKSDTDPVPAALAFAKAIRVFLEPHWAAWHEAKKRRTAGSNPADRDTPPSEGMCRFTAVFLAAVLPEELGGLWRIRGGSPWPPLYPNGGLADSQGTWHSHYWLQQGRFILDITADQFGHEPVVYTSSNDPRYRANYSARELRRHLAEARTTPAQWLTAYRSIRPSLPVQVSTVNTRAGNERHTVVDSRLRVAQGCRSPSPAGSRIILRCQNLINPLV
jgi:hypothetical protein